MPICDTKNNILTEKIVKEFSARESYYCIFPRYAEQ